MALARWPSSWARTAEDSEAEEEVDLPLLVEVEDPVAEAEDTMVQVAAALVIHLLYHHLKVIPVEVVMAHHPLVRQEVVAVAEEPVVQEEILHQVVREE